MQRFVACCLLLTGAALVAQSPVGDPFPINDFTPGVQFRASAARQPDRSFVVVWQSEGADGDGTAVRARLFSGDGSPRSPEFQVTQGTAGDQLRPQVATDALGNFVVLWRGPDVEDDALFARLFSAAGAALGPEFQVNSETPLLRPWSAIHRNSAGDFVVSWAKQLSGGEVLAATFDASGTRLLDEFLVNTSGNTPASGARGGLEAGIRSDGQFVVVWTGEHEVGGYLPTTDIFQKRFSALGTPLSGEFQLSDPGAYGNYYSTSPALGVDDGDNFLVVWDTQLNLAWSGAFARRTLSTGTTGPIKELALASEGHVSSMAPSGEFVVVWADYFDYGNLSAARFDASGDRVAAFDFRDTFGRILHLSANPSDFVLIRAVDGPDWNLVGQLFSGTIFADGFESGDTGQWSQTVP